MSKAWREYFANTQYNFLRIQWGGGLNPRIWVCQWLSLIWIIITIYLFSAQRTTCQTGQALQTWTKSCKIIRYLSRKYILMNEEAIIILHLQCPVTFSMLWLYCDCSTRVTRHIAANLLLTKIDRCNKMPRQTSSTTASVYLQLRKRFWLSGTSNTTTTSFAISNNDARVPLAIDFGTLFFTRTTTAQSGWMSRDSKISNDEAEKDIKEWLKFAAERNMVPVQGDTAESSFTVPHDFLL